jgi:hypothetical protein
MIQMMKATEQLARRARGVLKQNDLGTMVMAAPRLYPHQWSWDVAFITIGLAAISVSRAITEMRTLLSAQWDTGMRPWRPPAKMFDLAQGLSAGAPAVRRPMGGLPMRFDLRPGAVISLDGHQP